ncbi:MAG: LytTR family DNA-binding domain-containing protein [Flavobacteriales bacterium]
MLGRTQATGECYAITDRSSSVPDGSAYGTLSSSCYIRFGQVIGKILSMAPGTKPISCLVIDDDDRSNHALAMELRRRSKEFTLLGQHTCFKEGIRRIQMQVPQVVFIDIGMPFFTGREMLGITAVRSFKMIFLAKENAYVHQPIKSSRFDCLLKPINAIELRRTLNRLVEGQGRPLAPWSVSPPQTTDFVFEKMALPTTNGHVFVEPNEIIYCEADNEYTRIKTKGSTHLISKHLKYFETRLNNNRFFRIHKSYLLNLEHIRSLVRTEGGHVIMSDDKLIPIGRSRKKEFSLLMGV